MALINYATAIQVLTPSAKWSMTDASNYSTLVWLSVDIPQPSQQSCDIEIQRQINEAPLASCKSQASSLLYATDWTSIPDVADPAKSNPYLMNQNAFLTYRSQLRQLAVNPVINPVWPTQPTPQWSS